MRRASGGDARITEVSLSAKGVEAFEQIMPTALRHQAQALKGFTPQDIAQLTSLLARIESNLDATTTSIARPRRRWPPRSAACTRT